MSLDLVGRIQVFPRNIYAAHIYNILLVGTFEPFDLQWNGSLQCGLNNPSLTQNANFLTECKMSLVRPNSGQIMRYLGQIQLPKL